MNRQEWKAFSHSLRAEAREFHAQHGGFENFRRDFEANGRRHTFIRSRDRRHGPQTAIKVTRLPDDTPTQVAAELLADAAYDRRMVTRWSPNAETYKRGARASIAEARARRLNPNWRQEARAAARAATA